MDPSEVTCEQNALTLIGHSVCATLQLLAASLGVAGLSLLAMLVGKMEPFWWGGKALLPYLFAMEGLLLGAIPSYMLGTAILRRGGATQRIAYSVIAVMGCIQGAFFPIGSAILLWAGGYLLSLTDQGSIVFWGLIAIVLGSASVVSASFSALLLLLFLRGKKGTGSFS